MERGSRSGFTREGRRQRGREASAVHAVRVVALRREPPDLDRFVAALLALALAELEGEGRAATGASRQIEQSSGR